MDLLSCCIGLSYRLGTAVIYRSVVDFHSRAFLKYFWTGGTFDKQGIFKAEATNLQAFKGILKMLL